MPPALFAPVSAGHLPKRLRRLPRQHAGNRRQKGPHIVRPLDEIAVGARQQRGALARKLLRSQAAEQRDQRLGRGTFDGPAQTVPGNAR